MSDKELFQAIQKEIAEGRVVEGMPLGNLRIYKYADSMVADRNAWNDINRNCRGSVWNLEDPNNPIRLTFSLPKFFNYLEMPETKPENLPNEPFEVFEKLDGSCGIGYYYQGRWQLATPGSLQSEQAITGSKMLQNYNLDVFCPLSHTPVFEIIYPGNQIVLNYSNRTELVLLAVFNRDGQELPQSKVDELANVGKFSRPRRYDYNQINQIPLPDGIEGYVIRYANGLRMKIKTLWYVRIHRLLGCVAPKRVLAIVRGLDAHGETPESVRAAIPGHLLKEFDDIASELLRRHEAYKRAAIEAHTCLKDLTIEIRKNQALWIQKNVQREVWPFVFGLLDNKPVDDAIWRFIEKELKNENDSNIPSPDGV